MSDIDIKELNERVENQISRVCLRMVLGTLIGLWVIVLTVVILFWPVIRDRFELPACQDTSEETPVTTCAESDSIVSFEISEPDFTETVNWDNNEESTAEITSKIVTVKKTDNNRKVTQHITLNRNDQAKELSIFTIADTVNYSIVGTLTTHTLNKGEYLTKLALRYYGTKKLWPYIAKYNGLNSSASLYPGAKIKIPRLAEVNNTVDTGKSGNASKPVAERKTHSEENDLLDVSASDMSKSEIKQVIMEMEREMENESPNGTEPKATDDIYAVSDAMPTYAGEYGELVHYFQDNIVYPPYCKNNNIEGKVVVAFIVEADGSITNPRVVKGVHEEIDKEAIRVVSSMPKWNPGTNDGVPVRVMQSLSISFSFNK